MAWAMSTFSDPKRVVAFPHLSLASGAIKGWDKRNQFYFQMLTSLANHYAFDIETPFEKLPETMQEVVLNGSGKEQIPFNYLNERGTSFQRSHSFEGILHNLQRRYHESDSLAVREELSKYINSTTCPDCAGTRLKREARHVKVGNQNIHQVCEVPLKQALTFFESLELHGRQTRHCR